MRKRLIFDCVLMGVVGALAAQVFMWLLHTCASLFLNTLAGYQAPGIPSEGGALTQVIGPHWLWLIPVVTTLGGLISGVLVYSLGPDAAGDGTDAAVAAFHRGGGLIRARVAPLRTVASAITIGSGGSAGREGPISSIAAGVSSVYATITGRGEKERRLLVLVGMASGLSAIFRSPIGTAIFAIEVLYSEMEFDAAALLLTMLGSVTAYAVNGLFTGWMPLFLVPEGLGVTSIEDYLWYGLLGLIAGPVATLIPEVFYRLRDLFQAIPIPPHFKPALGGLGVGLLALAVPQVLAGGYGWIQYAIDGKLAVGLLGVLVLAKLLAFSLTVSSGGSGGVFAPTLFIGAMLGGLLAHVLHTPPAAFAVVGMAAVFGGAARIPIATLLMVTEMTGGYNLLVPAALAVVLSHMVQVNLSRGLKYKSLYEAQVPSPWFSPAHRVDQVRATLRIMQDGRFSLSEAVGHLDLLPLLDSGVPMDLPDGKQLITGVLREDSDCIGQPIGEGCLGRQGSGMETVAVFRKGETLLPHSGETYQAGDEILIVADATAREAVARHLDTKPGGGGKT